MFDREGCSLLLSTGFGGDNSYVYCTAGALVYWLEWSVCGSVDIIRAFYFLLSFTYGV